MRLITGTSVLLYASCALAFVVPFIKHGARSQLGFTLGSIASWRPFAVVLGLFLGLYLVGIAMHCDAASGLWWFIAGMMGYGVLSVVPFAQPGLRGAILLIIALALTGSVNDTALLALLLPSLLFGLTAGRFVCANPSWEDYCLPASWCIGTLWIALSSPESLMAAHQSLLAVFLSVVLLLRALQSLPILPEKNALIRPAFVVITGGLAAWLLTQTLLVQPALLKWVWLLAGGSLLGFLLTDAPDAETAEASLSASLLRDASQLVLIGIAALVASRLFGTLGWVVLAVGLLANLRASRVAILAALFLLGRSLLQVYILQYNPNVTGINMMHPYASAALYAGVAGMLLLPGLISSLPPSNQSDSSSTNPLAWALLPFGAAMAGALSNYFLHAEATGSLLVALTMAGLGAVLLNPAGKAASAMVMLFPLMTINSALLAHELLNSGNEAEKSQKIMVLGAVLLIVLLAGGLLWRGAGSGRKPVQVS